MTDRASQQTTSRQKRQDDAIYREWKHQGLGWADIAERHGISTDDVRIALRRMGEEVEP